MLSAILSFLATINVNEIAKALWVVISAGLFISITTILFRLHKNPTYPNFNLLDLFIDADTNRVDTSKFMLIVTFAVVIWAYIYAVLFGFMTTEFTTVILTAFVGNHIGNRLINKASPPTPSE